MGLERLKQRELDYKGVESRHLPLEIHILQGNHLPINALLKIDVLVCFNDTLLLFGLQEFLLQDKDFLCGSFGLD